VDMGLDCMQHNVLLTRFRQQIEKVRNGLKWLILGLRKGFMVKKTTYRLLQRLNL
jgi:hypothetical protein